MIDPQSISTISDLRFKTKAVLKKGEKAPVFIFSRSVPTGVYLSYAQYRMLMSDLEDYYSAQEAAEYEKEDKSKVKWYSQKEVEKILAQNDKLAKV